MEEGENVVDSSWVVVVVVVVVVGSGVVVIVEDGSSSVSVGSSVADVVVVGESVGQVSSAVVVGAGVAVVSTGVVVKEEESSVVEGKVVSSVVVYEGSSVAVETLSVERLPPAPPGQKLDDQASSEAVAVAVDKAVDLFVVTKKVPEEEKSVSWLLPPVLPLG